LFTAKVEQSAKTQADRKDWVTARVPANSSTKSTWACHAVREKGRRREEQAITKMNI
jgi:hypothetical protein